MLQPGTILDHKYSVQAAIGRGGFGHVYLADEALLGQQVAIKELIPALVGDEASLRRFLAEAKATMRLTHERIVRTYNVFSDGGNYYIVMEWMAGGSLEACLQQRGQAAAAAMPLDQALRMAADVCDGLAHAHAHGVVHCDLKPANILFTGDEPGERPGTAKVADFGIAHVSEQMLTRSWLTPAGFVAGTLPYMSPEQTEGVRDDPRIDVYALGAVLYRVLTGRTYLDFDQRDTPRAQADNVYRIHNQQPSSPRAVNEQVPPWLSEVLLTALAKRPEERYATAAELKAALERPGAAAAGGTAVAWTVEVPGRGGISPASAPVIQAGRPPTPAAMPPASGEAAGPLAPGAPPLSPAAAHQQPPGDTPLSPAGGPAGGAGAMTPQMTVPPAPARARPSSPPAATPAAGAVAWPSPEADARRPVPALGSAGAAGAAPPAGARPMPAASGQPPRMADGAPAPQPWRQDSPAAPAWPRAASAPPAAADQQEPLPSWFWPGVVAAIVLAVALIVALGALFDKGGRATAAPEAVVVLVSETPSAGPPTEPPTRLETAAPAGQQPAASRTPRPMASRTPRPTPTDTEVPPPTDTPTPETPTPETPTAEQVSPSDLQGRIVYAAEPSGSGYQDNEIYIAGGDGHNVARLTDNMATEQEPDLEPSGKRIAFVSIPNGKGEIYTMNPDGKQQARLTNNLYWERNPAWSPDGKLIAFESDRPQPGGSYDLNNGDIYVMNADGSNARLVVDTGKDDEDPDWSPDGRRLVFASRKSSPGDDLDLWIVNVDGSGLVHLVDDPARDDLPAWSPDGTRIAFTSDRGGDRNIWVIGVDGSGLLQLTFHSEGEYSPTWSPDGKYIAFVRAKHLYVIPAGGGEALKIVDDEEYEFDPSWGR